MSQAFDFLTPNEYSYNLFDVVLLRKNYSRQHSQFRSSGGVIHAGGLIHRRGRILCRLFSQSPLTAKNITLAASSWAGEM